MEQTLQPMGSLIGFDPAAAGRHTAASHPGRRASDADRGTFAEVFDLAAYASSGSREAARVAAPPRPAVPAHGHLDATVQAAADRLYTQLTGGNWSPVEGKQAGGTVVMRLHDAEGNPLREVSITELQGPGADPGPAVA